MSVTTSRMHLKQLNHKILQVKVNTMRSSDILSQRPQHLCTGVYTSKLMRPVHSKVEVRLMHSDNYSRIYYESLSKSSNFSSYRLYVWPHKSLIFFTKFVTISSAVIHIVRPKTYAIGCFLRHPKALIHIYIKLIYYSHPRHSSLISLLLVLLSSSSL